MSTYAPGTVAMVTAYNRPAPYRAFFDGKTWREVADAIFCVDSPTTVRPLVVLDVDYTKESREELLDILRSNYYTSTADQIEAQTKPPRIDEPGLWGVVNAPVLQGGYVWQWVHHPEHVWLNAEGDSRKWDDLIDPTLIREGVTR